MKKQFSFVKYLTKKDVLELLKRCNFSLASNYPQSLRKHKEKDGTYTITIKATNNNKNEAKDELENILFKNRRDVGLMYAMMAISMGDSWSVFSGKTSIFEISDFAFVNLMPMPDLFGEDVSQMLTKKYHEFMKEKFGTFYVSKFKKYYKKIMKEQKEQENCNEEKESDE